MSRRARLRLMLALFAISFVTLGKAPRMPEPRGQDIYEITLRRSAPAGEGEAF